jgi:hypothetical protein
MKPEKETQINFPIDVKPDNPIVTLNKSFDKRMIKAKAIGYFRSFPFMLSFIFTWITLIYIAVQVYQNYNMLPGEVPLIYSQALSGWEVINKEIFLYFLGGFLAFTLISPFINSKIYFFDKRLVLVMSIGIIIIDFFIIIGFSEIFSLLLK